MESSEFSLLSSLRGEPRTDDYIKPHYKESYRLAIDCLVKNGRDSYQEFLKGERIGSFLSEEELLFIAANVEQLPPQNHIEETNGPPDNESSSGTYWPVHSDVVTPDLDLGWPDVMHELLQTNIDLLFHPPRPNNPTIKEVVRKKIQEARQVIAIVMDKFTDVDIFKETVEASIRGVPVYILLDDYHLKSFLTMAENQDVKLQQLRNMRVRTVKGQDYLCRSGAKFHGAMEQKFILVDCHTAIYGSYSFAWSFEKINLSMVQVISGHLVKSYDEEFRTLYARSAVPAELCPADVFQTQKSHSAQKIDRRDQLRHTLDTVYRRTCERRLSARDINERLLEEDSSTLGVFDNGIAVENQMPHYQTAEGLNFLKRHSYAGERQDGCIPQNIRPRASNWNLHRETANGPNNYSTDNYLQVPQLYRGQNMRQSYNGNDKQILSMQQNMPTLEKTSKSFMRSMRIESYLNNPDTPFAESCEYLEQFEPQDKANSFMQGRMRTSLVFRSTIPEQMEPNRHNNTSAGIGHSVPLNNPVHYSSMQWNPSKSADNRMNNDDYMLGRQSLQNLDDFHSNTHYAPGRNSYQSTYASLGRPKGGHMITNPDMLSDSWQKRHSVADPKSKTEYPYDSPGHMYGAYTRTQGNRSTAAINAQNGSYTPNLGEDHRSVSHYDVNSIASSKSSGSHIWQEPPCRTVSAAALDVNRKDLSNKSGNMDSHQFLSKSSKKIKSLLHLPSKKENSIRGMETLSLKSGDSTDTITAEDEAKTSCVGRKPHLSTAHPARHPPVSHQSSSEDEQFKSSKPRFRMEEPQNPLHGSLSTASTQKKSLRPGLEIGSWSKERGAETRLYSRFEPFCSLDKKNSSTAHTFGSTRSHEKTTGLFKGEAAFEHSFTRGVRGHHENKLEKFFHRVGNLINKNK
ncbi:protein FAM83B [Salarias fasciatus]|uniref:protein FAM83B n=1 Tax=Salarias fasciatus TaxID=181472 RepID=UPI001176AAC4|nr:protein FAM83B [Salarias fasciatus]